MKQRFNRSCPLLSLTDLFTEKMFFFYGNKITDNKYFFVTATKNFAAATKLFVDRTKHFVVVTKYFLSPFYQMILLV